MDWPVAMLSCRTFLFRGDKIWLSDGFTNMKFYLSRHL
ncbi:hypothetical protein THIARS_50068 [Thiomonas delicata]|uniref:Uncharacterized protein n=1 Tax=Thiomonas delicata TaxID=364030 RepID=A0A238D0T4_THIDL|nr:hypothetical protein THIARS_50068 [Thiomonas delicata]